MFAGLQRGRPAPLGRAERLLGIKMSFLGLFLGSCTCRRAEHNRDRRGGMRVQMFSGS
jgi:hypothetical protein